LGDIDRIGGLNLLINFLDVFLLIFDELLTLFDMVLKVLDVLLSILKNLSELLLGRAIGLTLNNILELLDMLSMVLEGLLGGLDIRFNFLLRLLQGLLLLQVFSEDLRLHGFAFHFGFFFFGFILN